MRDMEMHEWRGPLQKARALYKKIETIPQGPARDALLLEHKKLLEQARKNLGQEERDSAVEK